jgi:hypothetical protein
VFETCLFQLVDLELPFRSKILSRMHRAHDMQLLQAQVGWPLVIPSNERQLFASKVHDLKRKALSQMVAKGEIELRKGK